MRRLVELTFLIALLVVASPTQAAVPRVGFATAAASDQCDKSGCSWRLSFAVWLPQWGGNHVTFDWAADGSHWTIDDPQTLLNGCTGIVFRHTECAMPQYNSYPYFYENGCSMYIGGPLNGIATYAGPGTDTGPGADVITVRNHTTTRIVCPDTVYTATGPHPGFVITIRTGGGNDTVYARDGIYSDIDCGAGAYDVAYVDFGDKVANCEQVHRG